MYSNPLNLNKNESTKARHKLIKKESEESLNSWMECPDKKEIRYVRGVGKTFIQCLDSGTVNIKNHTDNEIKFNFNGRKLNGEYHLIRTENGWRFYRGFQNLEKSVDLGDYIIYNGNVFEVVYKK